MSMNPADFRITLSPLPDVTAPSIRKVLTNLFSNTPLTRAPKKKKEEEKKAFSKFLQSIGKHATSIELEEELQQAWFEEGDWCSYYDYHSTSAMIDTHSNPLPNGRKPDIVHVVPGFLPAEATIVAVGDLKRLRRAKKATKGKASKDTVEIFTDTNFSPASCGRALDFARVISEGQSFRKEAGVLSYVSNGKYVQFYLYRGPDDIIGSPPLPLDGTGGQWYFGLMTTNLADMGMAIPSLTYNEQKIKVLSCLGRGGSGVVFLCSCDSIEGNFAFKVFSTSALCEAEEKTILSIRNNITMKEYVVDVIGKTDDNLALILQPVCEDISRRDLLYTGDQLIQIINVVCEINIICKLSLRDLRPSNILVQNNGNICIIDFGSVVAMDQVVPYYGASKFASSRILEHLSSNVITFPIQFGDDYHSLVRLCYVSIISGAYPQLKRLASHNYQEIMKFWKSRLASEAWHNLDVKESYCEEDYGNLCTFVGTLLDPEKGPATG